MTARRVSDDPRLPPLYAERTKLEAEVARLNHRLADIQREVLTILHPHGVNVTGRHPLHFKRKDDLPVPLPASTALALKVMSNGVAIELPEPHGNGVELMVFAPPDRSAPPADGWHAPEVQ